MLTRKRAEILLNRRGLSMVEAASIYPVTLLLLVGGLVLGVGVFRYEQLQSLAREGARFASVRGPDYAAAASGNEMATTSDVLNYLTSSGLSADLSSLTCTSVAYSSTTLPCSVAVTLQYTWVPGSTFGTTTWTVTSTALVTY
jgi:hypothetical protein